VQIALLDFSFSLSSALFIVVYVSFFSVFSVFFFEWQYLSVCTGSLTNRETKVLDGASFRGMALFMFLSFTGNYCLYLILIRNRHFLKH